MRDRRRRRHAQSAAAASGHHPDVGSSLDRRRSARAGGRRAVDEGVRVTSEAATIARPWWERPGLDCVAGRLRIAGRDAEALGARLRHAAAGLRPHPRAGDAARPARRLRTGRRAVQAAHRAEGAALAGVPGRRTSAGRAGVGGSRGRGRVLARRGGARRWPTASCPRRSASPAPTSPSASWSPSWRAGSTSTQTW